IMKKNIIALAVAAMLTVTSAPAAVFASGSQAAKASGTGTAAAAGSAGSESGAQAAGAEKTAAAGTLSDPSEASASELLSAGSYEKDTLLVVFDDDTSNSSIRNVIDSEDADCEKIVNMSSDQKVAQVTISDSDTMKSAINGFRKKSKVRYVQPNYKYTCLSTDTYLSPSLVNSGRYAYYIDDVNAKEAWSVVEAKKDHATTEVAVLDTGVDTKHADLKQNIIYSGKKYPAYQRGHLYYYDEDDQGGSDASGHGTHVTGIIGATYNNGKGAAGVASGDGSLVRVRNIGIYSDSGAFTIDIIKGLNYVKYETKAKVVNMSIGNSEDDYAMDDAIKDAYYNYGILVVAASGNENQESVGSPTATGEVLSVNATGRKSSSGSAADSDYSNYGINTDVAAPGTNIMSTYPGKYAIMSGTSMAAPVVTSAAALILDVNPDLTPAQISNIICATTGQIGYNKDSSKSAFGEVDCEAAVKAARDASTSGSVTSIEQKESAVTLSKGDDMMLEYVTYPASTLVSESDVSWSSSNPSVAELETRNGRPTGRVIARKAGTSYVTVTVKGRSATWMVNVKDSSDPVDITLEIMTYRDNFFTGDALNFDAEARDSSGNALDNGVDTETSDDRVAFASAGVLICMRPGTATITARVRHSSISTSKTITVYNRPKSIRMTRSRSRLMPGESYTFKAQVTGRYGTGKEGILAPTWYSSDPSVASVDPETGKVTAKKAGTCYITADSNYSIVRCSAKLTVVKSSVSSSSYKLRKKSSAKTSITLKWKRIPAAYGYQLQRVSSGGRYKTIKTLRSTAVSYKDKGLKAGRKYRYRIRAYYNKASGGRKYFSWSKSVSIRTDR
ncbi:MAG: S8 family serine peptidase, partial [Anaerovoracaceae bacterium]